MIGIFPTFALDGYSSSLAPLLIKVFWNESVQKSMPYRKYVPAFLCYSKVLQYKASV